MADSGSIYSQSSIAANSYDTALCVIPPQSRREEIDKLRSLYDRAYGKWPPHINLIYPFVSPEHLSQAKEKIESHLYSTSYEADPLKVALGGAGLFKLKKDITVFLQENGNKGESVLGSLRSEALRALGTKVTPSVFHLTVGQAQDNSVAAQQFLVDKVNLLPAFEFEIASLAILVREKTGKKTDAISQMRLWGNIDLLGRVHAPSADLWSTWASFNEGPSPNVDAGNTSEVSFVNRQVRPGSTYAFDETDKNWCVCTAGAEVSRPATLSVSSYNVLLDSEYPPSRERDPLSVDTILSESAYADVLVLQEASDDFLSYLLRNEEFRKTYPFTSHGPPSQADIGPLPSLRNVVILSRWFFNWEFIPFHRRHKGAVVASFPSVLDDVHRLVVTGMHLTAGLTDGSVVAKKVQLQSVISHLKQKYSNDTWIVAGDFNLPTSRHTIDQAVKDKSISAETSRILDLTDTVLSASGLLDAWVVARIEGMDETSALDANDLAEGEEGATFNPRENPLAAYISGTPENRPQRYDRILVGSQGRLTVTKFSHFGRPTPINGTISVASDHYGVRAMFKIHPNTEDQGLGDLSILQERFVYHKRTPQGLSDTAELAEALSKCAVFPNSEDTNRYRQAFELVKAVLLGGEDPPDSSVRSAIGMVIVPVGSYALDVWTPESDIDCLCIGSISSKTFFQLARQRIRKAEEKGVRLLRKVEANTGTMLELSVNGVSMDLQYCPAANVVQRWSDFSTLQSTDTIFNLPILSLRKLKPIRDLTYLKRTLPSVASFRLAYHFIKQWAIDRGIYSAKFGYFGGVHITLMLSWVAKRLAHDTGSVSAGDLILSFFAYYTNFDWQNDMVYDAFFYKKKPRYQRSAREPMVILGFHAPSSNIAHTATAPGLQVLVSELRQAEERLSTPGITWDEFFDTSSTGSVSATKDFLGSFESYVKIDIQYWGRALSRGEGLVGWVESRCINLVVDIHKVLPHLHCRIWPYRFADTEANESETYYHGCYLIGLSRTDNSAPVSQEDRSEAKVALEKVFDQFLTQVRADDKYYDESSAWIGVSLARPSGVKNLHLDEREWGDYTPDMEPDSNDEEDLEETADEKFIPSITRKLPVRLSSSATTMPVSSNKLRPASDVLNRLRWDSNLDPSDYIVGYEDRFLGAKETSLEKWKTEQTDEEFIPQHRILYFKKKGEAGSEVIWERATRIDKVFGSGAGSG